MTGPRQQEHVSNGGEEPRCVSYTWQASSPHDLPLRTRHTQDFIPSTVFAFKYQDVCLSSPKKQHSFNSDHNSDAYILIISNVGKQDYFYTRQKKIIWRRKCQWDSDEKSITGKSENEVPLIKAWRFTRCTLSASCSGRWLQRRSRYTLSSNSVRLARQVGSVNVLIPGAVILQKQPWNAKTSSGRTGRKNTWMWWWEIILAKELYFMKQDDVIIIIEKTYK